MSATQVQFRRGSTAQLASFIGAVGEVTVDTSKSVCVVHDGFTAGGYPLLLEDGTNCNFSAGSLSSCALKFANDPNTGIIRPAPDTLALVTDGVARLTIDSSGSTTLSGNVTIIGNLSVSGSFTTENLDYILALG